MNPFSACLIASFCLLQSQTSDFSQEFVKIFETEHIKVCGYRSSFREGHLQIRFPGKDIPTLDDLCDIEIMMRKIEPFYGSNGYTLTMSFYPFVVEFMPGAFYRSQANHFDSLQKIHTYAHLFFPMIALPKFHAWKDVDTRKLQDMLSAEDVGPLNTLNISWPKMTIEQSKEEEHFLLKLLESCTDHRDYFLSELSKQRKETFFVTECAFCAPEIAKNYLYQGQDMVVLANRNPYGATPHFLVTPHYRHHWTMANEVPFEAAKERFAIILKLIPLLCKKESIDASKIRVLCQNGPASGQTVPHNHYHVLAIPDLLSFSLRFLRSLFVGCDQNLSEEKIRSIQTQYIELRL